jgi:hypothetical protein
VSKLAKNDNQEQQQALVDTDADRYPKLSSVLNKIQHHVASEIDHVERVEVYCFASGEASYRVWLPKAEDPEIGTFPPE